MAYIQERFWGKQTKKHGNRTVVLYMSFERFLLTVESRDLSQADKNYYKSIFFSKAE